MVKTLAHATATPNPSLPSVASGALGRRGGLRLQLPVFELGQSAFCRRLDCVRIQTIRIC